MLHTSKIKGRPMKQKEFYGLFKQNKSCAKGNNFPPIYGFIGEDNIYIVVMQLILMILLTNVEGFIFYLCYKKMFILDTWSC